MLRIRTENSVIIMRIMNNQSFSVRTKCDRASLRHPYDQRQRHENQSVVCAVQLTLEREHSQLGIQRSATRSQTQRHHASSCAREDRQTVRLVLLGRPTLSARCAQHLLPDAALHPGRGSSGSCLHHARCSDVVRVLLHPDSASALPSERNAFGMLFQRAVQPSRHAAPRACTSPIVLPRVPVLGSEKRSSFRLRPLRERCQSRHGQRRRLRKFDGERDRRDRALHSC